MADAGVDVFAALCLANLDFTDFFGEEIGGGGLGGLGFGGRFGLGLNLGFGGFRRFLFLLFFAHLKSPYFLVTTPTVLRAPLRVRAFVLVLCPRTGRPLAWRSPR